MIAARVAGVPIPESFIASRSSSSSTSLPAVSIARQQRALGVAPRRLGLLLLGADLLDLDLLALLEPGQLLLAALVLVDRARRRRRRSRRTRRASRAPASACRGCGTRASATVVSTRVFSNTASGWKTARKRRTTRS